MTSAIYKGWVRHRRFAPNEHRFSYRVFMLYLRLDELPHKFDRVPGWSARGPALARFRREDFHGPADIPLDTAIRNRVEKETGRRPRGPIYLLANLRYFGYIINPLACYYCYSQDGQHLEYIVAEVNNTPWDERHSYVLRANEDQRWLRTQFRKDFHVSPFHPMDMTYHWHSNMPGEKLCLHLANHQDQEKVFDASLSLQRQPMTRGALLATLALYPVMTLKVAAAIYWQALRLWLKGTPIHPHPQNNREIAT